jgi:hypothetical protein
MRVDELISKLREMPKQAEVRIVESCDDETRHENFWVVDIDIVDGGYPIADEVIIIGME